MDSRLVALAKLPELRGTCSEVIGPSLTSNRFRYFAPVGTPADAVIAVKLTAELHTSEEDRPSCEFQADLFVTVTSVEKVSSMQDMSPGPSRVCEISVCLSRAWFVHSGCGIRDAAESLDAPHCASLDY